MIAHIDIDAFFASVEQALIPALRGRPVAVGSGCIASCSYEARARGLSAGMSLPEARRRCPALVVMPGSYGIYRCFAERVWELCRETAPAVETYLDDAYLDLAGTEMLYGDPGAPGGPIERLRARVHEATGLTVTAGVGPNRMIARLAGRSAKPDGLAVVAPGEAERFLVDGDRPGDERPGDERPGNNRPVGDLPGVGPKIAATLAKFNVCTVRDMRALSREELVALFGKVGDALYDRARGRDTRAVSVREVPKTISRETTFHRETTDPVEIRAMLHYLLERAMKTAREFGLVARTVGLKVRYADFKGASAQKRLARAAGLESDVFGPLLALLGRLHVRRVALRLIGVTLSGLSLDGADQMSLIEPEDGPDRDRRGRLADALDELRGRFGFSAVTAGRSVDLLGRLRQDSNGYVLRTPCLTK